LLPKGNNVEATFNFVEATFDFEVHQSFTQCSQIITDELVKIRMAILQYVSECQAMNEGE